MGFVDLLASVSVAVIAWAALRLVRKMDNVQQTLHVHGERLARIEGRMPNGEFREISDQVEALDARVRQHMDGEEERIVGWCRRYLHEEIAKWAREYLPRGSVS